jgi:hypothetical protein
MGWFDVIKSHVYQTLFGTPKPSVRGIIIRRPLNYYIIKRLTHETPRPPLITIQTRSKSLVQTPIIHDVVGQYHCPRITIQTRSKSLVQTPIIHDAVEQYHCFLQDIIQQYHYPLQRITALRFPKVSITDKHIKKK